MRGFAPKAIKVNGGILRVRKKELRLFAAVLLAVATLLIIGVATSFAWTAPTLDGKLDQVYIDYGTITRYSNTTTHTPTGLDNFSTAYMYVLEDANFIYIFYHQDMFYSNDNSYGANSTHWESRPSGFRSFEDIWESDQGEFTFKDGSGAIVAHFQVDQLSVESGTPSGYGNLGFTGDDGVWLDGPTSNQVYFEISSPMEYNLNSTGYCTSGTCTCGTTADLLEDSPLVSGSYVTTDAGCNDWQWYNGWEIKVDKAAFATFGFGVVIGNHHNSPTKECQQKKNCPTDLFLAENSIGDRVWLDINRDEVQDSGEPGLQGVTVNLIDPRDGRIIESQVTDANGKYLFEMLSNMYYLVQVDASTLPSGFVSTLITTIGDYHTSYENNACGSDCIQRDGATYTVAYYIDLDDGEHYRAADFGYAPSGAAIGDYVWSDASEDGLQDMGEPGISGVLVELLDGSGTPTGTTTTTDSAGWYMFAGLSAGNHQIQIAASNFTAGQPLEGYTLTVGTESQQNPTGVISLITDQIYVLADFGYFKSGLGTIGDLVWFDLDNDEDDAGEPGAVGVTLALHLDTNEDGELDPGEPSIATAITNASGAYLFSGLVLDEFYMVTVTDSNSVLDGYSITTYWGDDPGEPTINRYNDPAPVNLTTGSPDALYVDFGYNLPGSIGDTVFYDWNDNDVQDAGEIGVSGVTVTLSGDASATTTTAADGTYMFTDLDSGDYDVTITIPSGYVLSSTGSNPHGTITLTGNQSYQDADFGILCGGAGACTAYSIGNLVWHDTNADGDVDGSEPGVDNVTLALYEDTNGDQTLDPTEPLLGTTTTSGGGAYTFYGLLAGDYFVVVTDDNGELDGQLHTDGIPDTDNNSQVTPYPVAMAGNVVHADFGFDPTPTRVFLSSFNAFAQAGNVVVQWTTSAELGTLGFYVYREDPIAGRFVKLNNQMLPGLITVAQGGTYQYVDSGASPGMQYTYKLVEVETNGGERTYGPFTVTVRGASNAILAPMTSSYMSSAHESLRVSVPTLREPEKESLVEPAVLGQYKIFIPFFKPGLLQTPVITNTAKVFLNDEGLYHLDVGDIAIAMSIQKWQAKELIKDQRLQVTNQGQQIAYLREGNNNGIYFFAPQIDSRFTNENVFWISDGQGTWMKTIAGEGPTALSAETTFSDALHIEDNKVPANGVLKDAALDFWFWDYVLAAHPSLGSKNFTFDALGVAASGSSSLAIRLQGASDSSANPDHHALVYLNGTLIGETSWNGTSAHNALFGFDQGLLNEGANTIEVKGVLDAGVPKSLFFIDSFDLAYNRYAIAVDDALYASGLDQPIMTIDGFSSNKIMVFDVTNPGTPEIVEATTITSSGGSHSVSFEPEGSSKRYLAITLDSADGDAVITSDSGSDLRSTANVADYLIITPNTFMDVAQTLADYRQGLGHNALVVDLQDIYDEFNHGIAEPEAVHEFLTYAYQNWSSAPAYVLLAGSATIDFKDYLGYGENIVPTLLVGTPYGIFAADNLFGDVVGSDGLTEIAIGRLPVVSPDQLAQVIAKIIAYESSTGDWRNEVVLLADDPDAGGNFPADSDDLAGLFDPGYTVEKIYLSQQSIGEARQALLDTINDGAALLNFIGHGGVDRLAQEGLLTTADVASLSNGSKLPVVTALTCNIGRHELPGFTSLGEALVTKAGGGAVAVWAPTGLSLNRDAKILGDQFFQSVLQSGDVLLGDAILNALETYAASSSNTFSILEMFTLLGDPALRINLVGQ